MEYWRLLAHNHWITLDFKILKVRLCARCSGYLIGLFSSLFAMNKFETWFFTANPLYLGSLVSVLATPLIIDWLTQSWGWRSSTNQKRLITGILMGFATTIFSAMSLNTLTKEILFAVIMSSVIFLGHK
ncbi:DUF2085 domain-containing protein [Candidatus Bathyarchaeota archaeon]|nr:DUF2085 domain-containing protein [Candidatus Bathyarchaeota archaeon]